MKRTPAQDIARSHEKIYSIVTAPKRDLGERRELSKIGRKFLPRIARRFRDLGSGASADWNGWATYFGTIARSVWQSGTPEQQQIVKILSNKEKMLDAYWKWRKQGDNTDTLAGAVAFIQSVGVRDFEIDPSIIPNMSFKAPNGKRIRVGSMMGTADSARSFVDMEIGAAEFRQMIGTDKLWKDLVKAIEKPKTSNAVMLPPPPQPAQPPAQPGFPQPTQPQQPAPEQPPVQPEQPPSQDLTEVFDGVTSVPLLYSVISTILSGLFGKSASWFFKHFFPSAVPVTEGADAKRMLKAIANSTKALGLIKRLGKKLLNGDISEEEVKSYVAKIGAAAGVA